MRHKKKIIKLIWLTAALAVAGMAAYPPFQQGFSKERLNEPVDIGRDWLWRRRPPLFDPTGSHPVQINGQRMVIHFYLIACAAMVGTFVVAAWGGLTTGRPEPPGESPESHLPK